ncbi:hypothetical protein IWQ57_002697 [Coemansia nantahalensis]|uniref:Uncharacterized protein n=1 Tax=Coemansia nantahalensis TaxID=2789366 RepID=A0ACC1JZ90_9FUNG|nr:hypothetical protein IWQ57_002697 [Coemansia nantahalensis]
MKQGCRTFQERRDTFLRRGRFRWPYLKYSSYLAQPDTLASAGFVFGPAKDAPDNVQCFHCGFELTGWEATDDPFAEHHSHQPGCAYARLHCQTRAAVAGNRVEWTGWPIDARADLAGEERAAERQKVVALRDDVGLRQATFDAGGWPHAGRANWHVTPDRLARAGFYYTPEWPGDDTATCAFCGYALAEWEPDDDPTREHARRSAECLFFRLGSAADSADGASANDATGTEADAAADAATDADAEVSPKRQRLSMADRTEQGADAGDSADGASEPGSDEDGSVEDAGSDSVDAQLAPDDGEDVDAEEGLEPTPDSPDGGPQEPDTQMSETQVEAPLSAMAVDEAPASSSSGSSSAGDDGSGDGGGEWELAEDEEDLTVEEFIRACCEQKIAALEASASQMIDAFMKRAEATRGRICGMSL